MRKAWLQGDPYAKTPPFLGNFAAVGDLHKYPPEVTALGHDQIRLSRRSAKGQRNNEWPAMAMKLEGLDCHRKFAHLGCLVSLMLLLSFTRVYHDVRDWSILTKPLVFISLIKYLQNI